MKSTHLFLIILSAFLLIGCMAIPVSTEKNSTLLVGEVVFVGSDYISNEGISFQEETTSGIEIALKNIATNELFRFSPGKKGLFYINLQEGKYVLDELYLRKERDDGAWEYISTYPTQRLFEIEKGKVNNIGKINWAYVDRKHEVLQTDLSIEVKDEFLKQFPKSNWNQKEWKYKTWSNEQWGSRIVTFSGEQISYYVKSDDGRDSSRLTIPRDLPVESRNRIEMEIKNKLNDISLKGDTSYYVKSENGLDSALLRIPNIIPENRRREIEAEMRQKMNHTPILDN